MCNATKVAASYVWLYFSPWMHSLRRVFVVVVVVAHVYFYG
jgi:hypothetical protein